MATEALSLLSLENYGCWCGNLLKPGSALQGNPVDPVDAACRRWSHCRSCSKQTQLCTNSHDPFEVYSLSFLNGARQDTCTLSTLTDCGSACCSCDTQLIEDLIAEIPVSYSALRLNLNREECHGVKPDVQDRSEVPSESFDNDMDTGSEDSEMDYSYMELQARGGLRMMTAPLTFAECTASL